MSSPFYNKRQEEKGMFTKMDTLWCSLLMSDYDYTTEYKTGSRILTADAMSSAYTGNFGRPNTRLCHISYGLP